MLICVHVWGWCMWGIMFKALQMPAKIYTFAEIFFCLSGYINAWLLDKRNNPGESIFFFVNSKFAFVKHFNLHALRCLKNTFSTSIKKKILANTPRPPPPPPPFSPYLDMPCSRSCASLVCGHQCSVISGRKKIPDKTIFYVVSM